MIKTSFAFLDETGTLGAARDPFFAIGVTKSSDPFALYSQIKRYRDIKKFYDEVKWNSIYHKNVQVMKDLIDIFFDTRGVRFSCRIFKKNELDLQTHFRGNIWQAYESFSILELKSDIAKGEIVTVLADDVSVPSFVRFESNVRDRINKNFNRLAVHGVCRVNSKGVEIVQITDLLLGAVVYDLKLRSGLIPKPGKAKKDVMTHLERRLDIKTFEKGLISSKFRVRFFNPK